MTDKEILAEKAREKMIDIESDISAIKYHAAYMRIAEE